MSSVSSPIAVLKNYWGYDQFRPLQEDIIESILSGKDTLALLPTGGGKSICYQVPALCKPGLCLVISPLIALMKDQVEQLRRRGITAFAIFSGMNRKEVLQTFQLASESNCKFLYVSPERLETALFKEQLNRLDINLIAVDEAHCVSQWGYDFRPPYLRIKNIRPELPDVPILALTASATPRVQEDIMEQLEFTEPNLFQQSFERPNLSYSVREVDSKNAKLLEIFEKVDGSGLVYCSSRRRTKEIADLLQLQGISADYYHAGLSQEQRNEKQEAWIKNEIRIMACTNAFGMGIDKPDVRIVVHADLPDCLENYYQEAGRAGRDGNKSYAVLLYQTGDPEQLRQKIEKRFPDLETIRSVYQALMNYLQLPVHAGGEQYFDFDLNDFGYKFHIDGFTITAVLQILSQESIISFNEQLLQPSKLVFTCSKQRIHELEKTQPEWDDIIKTLLRSYEGIFDRPAVINEFMVARALGIDKQLVYDTLHHLHQHHIVDYQPTKNDPQLYVHFDRVASEHLTIDLNRLAERKHVYLERMEAFLQFIYDRHSCRGQLIAAYFGAPIKHRCGICDNCVEYKKKPLSETEFLHLKNSISAVLHEKPERINDLIKKLPAYSNQQIWEVIRHMQAENKLKHLKGDLLSLH
ncbi:MULTISPECIES: RecQ family ATP-dependent DNA helicase [unclassified Paraflavitalea]|uniref:RecQ family ATP-dependent DNA helicase n=1 Tax=unclassified Paraflavitalea TaxID=2798305 RepID=UPI003D338668